MGVIVGHTRTLSKVPNPVPQVLLLVGPEGVGKSLVARVLAHASGARDLDVQWLKTFTRSDSKAVLAHHSRHPISSPARVTLANLTKADPAGLNSMLKLLEEPPPYSRFVFHSDVEPMLTIKSRCYVLRFGTLSDPEVVEVLMRRGMSEEDAKKAAEGSQGRVSVALKSTYNQGAAQSVSGLLEAFSALSAKAVEQALARALASPKEGEYDRRGQIAGLLAREIRQSVIEEAHVFSNVPVSCRMEALKILESPIRPTLKVRSAIWLMAVGS